MAVLPVKADWDGDELCTVFVVAVFMKVDIFSGLLLIYSIYIRFSDVYLNVRTPFYHPPDFVFLLTPCVLYLV